MVRHQAGVPMSRGARSWRLTARSLFSRPPTHPTITADESNDEETMCPTALCLTFATTSSPKDVTESPLRGAGNPSPAAFEPPLVVLASYWGLLLMHDWRCPQSCDDVV